MSVVATIRPDDWNLPLLLHVLGAMALVGALVLAVAALVLAWRDGSAELVRVGYRSLLLGVIPAWIVMRVSAQWIADEENVTDSEEAWVEVGFAAAEPGLLFIIIATVAAGLASRRATRAGSATAASPTAAVLSSLLLVIYLVAVWAMTTKPV